MHARQVDDEQAKLWNGPGGRAWVEAQELLDRVLEPFQDLLVEGVPAGSAARVLDVGCGTGSTTLAVGRRLGSKGRSIGIDISEPMIALARARAAQQASAATFVIANAQDHAFATASFERIISRFGVMFFSDSVAAFANLRRVASQDAELQCIAWRSAAENPFMTTAERAAAPYLPNLPARQPDAPGQFAFADRHKVQRILEKSGWNAIDIRPIDVPCRFALESLDQYLTKLGPVGLILQDADETTRRHITQTVRGAFDPYVRGNEVGFTAACWMIGARG